MKKALFIGLLCGSVAAPVLAKPTAKPSTVAMKQENQHAMQTMHRDMVTGMQSDDADVNFAAGMLAHHQGAVAMAQTELKYGKDAALRQMAQNIIQAQQAEIEQLQQWLQVHQADKQQAKNTQTEAVSSDTSTQTSDAQSSTKLAKTPTKTSPGKKSSTKPTKPQHSHH